MSVTEVRAVFETLLAVRDAIREFTASPRGGVPSGELYAVLMGQLTLETYDGIIETLIEHGQVERKNHFLRYVGKE